MEEKRMITITKEDGTTEEVEVLLIFSLNDTNKDYIIYSNGELDGDLQIVNAAILNKTEDGYSLEKVEDDVEWNKVKDVMRQVIKDNEE